MILIQPTPSSTKSITSQSSINSISNPPSSQPQLSPSPTLAPKPTFLSTNNYNGKRVLGSNYLLDQGLDLELEGIELKKSGGLELKELGLKEVVGGDEAGLEKRNSNDGASNSGKNELGVVLRERQADGCKLNSFFKFVCLLFSNHRYFNSNSSSSLLSNLRTSDPSCLNQPNYILSCYPTSSTILTQDIWSKFIFNSQFPTFIGSVYVDIYLYHSDSETIATKYLNVENARGSIGILPDENWWPVENVEDWIGAGGVGRGNKTFPYFFVIVEANSTLTGGEQHQSTFIAVQTKPPSTLTAALASISSASVASVLSQSSLTAHPSSTSASASSSSTSSNPTTSNTSLQNSNSNDPSALPNWAIALLILLGIFTLIAILVLSWFCLLSMRKKRQQQKRERSEGGRGEGGRNSLSTSNNSNDSSQSPILPLNSTSSSSSPLSPPPLSSSANNNNNINSSNPINPTSALLMTQAFRNELRKPKFDSSPHGSTSSSTGGVPSTPSPGMGGGIMDRRFSHASLAGIIGGVPDSEGEEGEGGIAGGGGSREIMNRSLEDDGEKIEEVGAVRNGGGKRGG